MPGNPLFKTIDPGHSYELAVSGVGIQRLDFLKKVPDGRGGLITQREGTTNEAVLAVLIDRLEYLNQLLPSQENILAISHLKLAQYHLQRRTMDRTARGVEGTHKA